MGLLGTLNGDGSLLVGGSEIHVQCRIDVYQRGYLKEARGYILAAAGALAKFMIGDMDKVMSARERQSSRPKLMTSLPIPSMNPLGSRR